MELEVAVNFEFLLDNFDFEKSRKQIKQGFVLEGSSGSAKTWDIIQFIIYYCEVYRDQGKDILGFRETYADVKKTILKDFIKVLRKYNLYNSKDHTKSHPQSYNLFGNIIYFTGLDGVGSHGERHDFIWGNEGMELNFDSFRQLNQRCNEVFILDYNPSLTSHWIFDSIIPRSDTKFFHSTLLNNPFLPDGQRREILAYEPTPENIDQGTADDYMWKVYGLGQRAMPTGLIFRYVTYIDEFPNIDYWYGMDFGFTNDPTVLVKEAIDGKNIYLECLSYEPMETPEIINEFLINLGVETRKPIIADSSDKYTGENKGTVEMVRDLKKIGWDISKVSKTQSINYWILKLKEYKIHIVKNKDAKKEQENYKWREVAGKIINQPIDKFNHFWDASRYGLMGAMQPKVQFKPASFYNS